MVSVSPHLMCFSGAVQAPQPSPTPAVGTLNLPEHGGWCAMGSPDPATEQSRPRCSVLQPCDIPSTETAVVLAGTDAETGDGTAPYPVSHGRDFLLGPIPGAAWPQLSGNPASVPKEGSCT